jgi:hypothetical protein
MKLLTISPVATYTLDTADHAATAWQLRIQLGISQSSYVNVAQLSMNSSWSTFIIPLFLKVPWMHAAVPRVAAWLQSLQRCEQLGFTYKSTLYL